MWDAFLDRTCQSCLGLRDSSSFCKRKTDLFSVEYLTYLHRDILSCLEFSMKNSKQSPRKGTSRSSQSYYEKYKNEQNIKKRQPPVYFKVNVEALKEKRPTYPPHCNAGEKCTCVKKFGKNVGAPDKNLAIIHEVDTKEVVDSGLQFRPARAVNSEEMVECNKVWQTVEGIDKKELTFPYKSRGGKSKKQGEKSKSGKYEKKLLPPPPPPPPPLPPPPMVKLKKKEGKKGTVIEDRSPSMPLYRDLLSRLNLVRWRIYKVCNKITK